jgi:hypothetical protein
VRRFDPVRVFVPGKKKSRQAAARRRGLYVVTIILFNDFAVCFVAGIKIN